MNNLRLLINRRRRVIQGRLLDHRKQLPFPAYFTADDDVDDENNV